MKRPLAYITAAWCGDPDTDMELAARYCRMAYEAGFSPICPILYLPLFINDAIVIFVIVYGRMIEIYLMTSLAPIPFATSANREAGHMGHNYFKSLFAIGFQGMLIMVCMAIYAVLVQSIATSGDMMAAIWECVGYTVLLVFVLFKTGSLSKSIFGAH